VVTVLLLGLACFQLLLTLGLPFGEGLGRPAQNIAARLAYRQPGFGGNTGLSVPDNLGKSRAGNDPESLGGGILRDLDYGGFLRVEHTDQPGIEKSTGKNHHDPDRFDIMHSMFHNRGDSRLITYRYSLEHIKI
jgi:hypothetical protein